ncbi:hypothetical protein, partial [Pseudoalteromonas sp. GW168-MNA-CIBAN-0100]|uniref:hypothetical protein n=1 Tax=Pseudoalteromonas sp. GW168-MNA-CIBAN-0100 TaxID=3140434 RepID=UPI003332DDFA
LCPYAPFFLDCSRRTQTTIVQRVVWLITTSKADMAILPCTIFNHYHPTAIRCLVTDGDLVSVWRALSANVVGHNRHYWIA